MWNIRLESACRPPSEPRVVIRPRPSSYISLHPFPLDVLSVRHRPPRCPSRPATPCSLRSSPSSSSSQSPSGSSRQRYVSSSSPTSRSAHVSRSPTARCHHVPVAATRPTDVPDARGPHPTQEELSACTTLEFLFSPPDPLLVALDIRLWHLPAWNAC